MISILMRTYTRIDSVFTECAKLEASVGFCSCNFFSPFAPPLSFEQPLLFLYLIPKEVWDVLFFTEDTQR